MMNFAQRLKTIRRQAGMSQEKLAEKLGVSRQAITKWETETGFPDVENIMALSALFHISMDELLCGEKARKEQREYLYESVTEYDIDRPKRYDLRLGGANALFVSGYEGEKLRVRLASNTLADLQKDCKLRLEDVKNHIDLEVIRKNGMTEAAAKEGVTVFVQLPAAYLEKLELAVHADRAELRALTCQSIELEGKINSLVLDGVAGTVEVSCNQDMDISCRAIEGAVELNQISATSRLSLPEGTAFTAQARGIATSISYERDGKKAEPFQTPDAGLVIELNGMKSELVISALSAKEPEKE